jgi:hypothetical protein
MADETFPVEDDPYGWAMKSIRDVMNTVSQHAYEMSKGEASVLSSICQYMVKLDPHWVGELPSIAMWDLEGDEVDEGGESDA